MKDIPTKAAKTGDLVQLMNQLEIGRFHFQLLGLCAAVVFMDGFDAQAIGYVAPSLSQAWSLAPGALGPVFGAGLFGIMLGALVGGPVADYVGRKRVIIFAALFFGVCTLITVFATDVQQLLIIRFITGVGLGAAMPNAIALISEYSPKRRHAIMVMVMFCGFSLGAALGGLVAGVLVPTFGWRSVFIFGGVVPLLLACIADNNHQDMGRSRGGLTSKLHAVVDANGLPVHLALTPGEAHDNRLCSVLLSALLPQTILLADRGYDADWIRELARQQGAWANIPPKRNRKDPLCFSPYLYRARNLIERFFNKIKQCRRIATRYDKLAANYLAFIKLASIRIWLRANESMP